MNKLIYYLIIINIVSFLLFGLDKYLAIKNKNRISEISLFFLMFIGGPIGSLLGMLIFHHKTRKIKFYIYVFLSILLWTYILLGKEVKIWNTH